MLSNLLQLYLFNKENHIQSYAELTGLHVAFSTPYLGFGIHDTLSSIQM